MKKRLRKKKHLGEFREWGREVSLRLVEGAGTMDFLEDFIEMIEVNGLCCGGGFDGKGNGAIVVELGIAKDNPKWEAVGCWLAEHRAVVEWSAGPVFDLWYGFPTE
jgi:uncharacterized protein YggL (DUF469 family)